MKTKTEVKKSTKEVSKSLIGRSVCITGRTKTARAVLKDLVIEHGGTFMTAVNHKCSYLIIADPDSDTIKANNARELGVKLISEDQFFKMIGME